MAILSSNSSDYYPPKGVIKFEKEIVDNSNSFDHSNGIFRAPVTGAYYFSYCSDTVYAFSNIYVYVNGNLADGYRFTANDQVDSSRLHEFEFTIDLKTGEKLSLYNYHEHSIRTGTGYSPVFFQGYLIN